VDKKMNPNEPILVKHFCYFCTRINYSIQLSEVKMGVKLPSVNLLCLSIAQVTLGYAFGLNADLGVKLPSVNLLRLSIVQVTLGSTFGLNADLEVMCFAQDVSHAIGSISSSTKCLTPFL